SDVKKFQAHRRTRRRLGTTQGKERLKSAHYAWRNFGSVTLVFGAREGRALPNGKLLRRRRLTPGGRYRRRRAGRPRPGNGRRDSRFVPRRNGYAPRRRGRRVPEARPKSALHRSSRTQRLSGIVE